MTAASATDANCSTKNEYFLASLKLARKGTLLNDKP